MNISDFNQIEKKSCRVIHGSQGKNHLWNIKKNLMHLWPSFYRNPMLKDEMVYILNFDSAQKDRKRRVKKLDHWERICRMGKLEEPFFWTWWSLANFISAENIFPDIILSKKILKQRFILLNQGLNNSENFINKKIYELFWVSIAYKSGIKITNFYEKTNHT